MARHNYCTLEHHQKMLDSGFTESSPGYYYKEVGTHPGEVSLYISVTHGRLDHTCSHWTASKVSDEGVYLVCNRDDNFQDPVTALVTAEVRGWRAQ